MEINNVLSGYISYANTQYEDKDSYACKTETQFKLTIQSQSLSSDDPLDYYKELCSLFPDIAFRLGDNEEETKHMGDSKPWFGYNDSLNQIGNHFGELSQVSVEIDVSVIRKMQTDPAFEKQVIDHIKYDCKGNYDMYKQECLQSGMSYMSYGLEMDGDRLQASQGYYHSPFSTEEELRKMWNAEGCQKKMDHFFEQKKAELIEVYLKMTSSCIYKKNELEKMPGA